MLLSATTFFRKNNFIHSKEKLNKFQHCCSVQLKIAVLNQQCESTTNFVKPTYFVLIIDGEQCQTWVVHEWETAKVAHALGHGFESMQQMWTPNW